MSKRRGQIALVGALLVTLGSGTAVAGKPERDKIDELKPKMAAAEKNVSAACGCNVKITAVWDSYKNLNAMFRIARTIDTFEETAKAYCQKPADKKAFCDNITGIEIRYNADGGFAELKGKTIHCGSSDNSYTGEHQFKKILDQF